MSADSVPHLDCTWKGLTVCACIALNLHISRFEPSGADGNWFKIGCSRYGDETISDLVQHQELTTALAIECIVTTARAHIVASIMAMYLCYCYAVPAYDCFVMCRMKVHHLSC